MAEEKLKEGVKFDQDKLRYDLVPADSLRQLVEIYTFGAKKYEDHNWRKGIKWSRIYGALQRHLNSFWEGENNDPESGKNHLAHAAWGCFTLLNYCDTHNELDDRILTGTNFVAKNKPVMLHEDKTFMSKEHPGVNIKEIDNTKKDKIQIYLAGTTSATQYRRKFKHLVKDDNRIIIRDPMEEVDLNIDLDNCKDFSQHIKLVHDDKELIKKCDVVVAYVQQYTAGTICEIIYAYENKIPVYLISNNDKVMNDPWVVSHISFGFESIEECINSIIINDLEPKK